MENVNMWQWPHMTAHSSKPNQVHMDTTERHCSPAEAVLVGKWAALPDFTEILKAHPAMWLWMILIKANALRTAEGSRLPWQGCTRHVNTCTCFEYLIA